MPDSKPSSGFAEIRCRRYRPSATDDRDVIIVEEPLELRVDGEAVVTVMRTPGHDRDLALGLLYSEGYIDSVLDLTSVALCGHRERGPGPDDRGSLTSAARDAFETGNVVDVRLACGPKRSPPSAPRPMSIASCGVCGKRTIADVLAATSDSRCAGPAAGDAPRCRTTVIAALPAALRSGQPLFERTGSVHGAALFDSEGRVLVTREDVGRHNAVDKVIGWALLAGRLPLSEVILQVSGRVSFEIVQKAYRAGIPIVAAVSGVSTLAAELAVQARITLVGFLREGHFTVYCHSERIEGE